MHRAITCALVACFLATVLSSCGVVTGAVVYAFGKSPRPGYRYYVPEGFNGWLVLHLGDNGAPPAVVEEDGSISIWFDKYGHGITSSYPEDGPLCDRYYYVSTEGLTRPIPPTEVGNSFTSDRVPGDKSICVLTAIGKLSDLGSAPETSDDPWLERCR